VSGHDWRVVGPCLFYGRAACTRCRLERHALACDAAIFMEGGAALGSRTWSLEPSCPPPERGEFDGSRDEGREADALLAAELAVIERALRGGAGQ
jgi:hypothetical protein